MPFTFKLCADDYALSAGVSIGILEALSVGRLTSTSVMTNRPLWPRAAPDLARLAPHAEVGLHLNLTLGAPLSPMPAFAPYKRFPDLNRVLRQARGGRLPEAEIRAEIAAQIDAFEDCFGRPPDYIDGHQHVHVLHGVRQQLFDELAERGLAGRAWLRNSSDRLPRIYRRKCETTKALALAFFARGFAGFSRFDPRRDYAIDFARYLVAPGPRHLVMCHPGHVDDELIAADPVTTTRENELAFLLSPRFEDILGAAGARIGKWTHQD